MLAATWRSTAKMSQKVPHGFNSELSRVLLAVMKDVAANPIQVCFYEAVGVVLEPEEISEFIEEFRLARLRLRRQKRFHERASFATFTRRQVGFSRHGCVGLQS